MQILGWFCLYLAWTSSPWKALLLWAFVWLNQSQFLIVWKFGNYNLPDGFPSSRLDWDHITNAGKKSKQSTWCLVERSTSLFWLIPPQNFAFRPSLNSFWGRHLRNNFGQIGAKLFKRPHECFAFNYLSRMWVTQSQWFPSSVHVATSWPVHAFTLRLLHVSFLSCKAWGYIFLSYI